MKKSKQILTAALLLCTLIEPRAQSPAFDTGVRLNMHREGTNVEIRWPAQAFREDASAFFPVFEVQLSGDLNLWQPVGERQRGSEALSSLKFLLPPALSSSRFFYRVMAVQPSPVAGLASGGAEVFGYDTAFAQELKATGQITLEQFAARFPTATNYLAALGWDPTTADFWPEFNVDPQEYNANLIPLVDDFRQPSLSTQPG